MIHDQIVHKNVDSSRWTFEVNDDFQGGVVQEELPLQLHPILIRRLHTLSSSHRKPSQKCKIIIRLNPKNFFFL